MLKPYLIVSGLLVGFFPLMTFQANSQEESLEDSATSNISNLEFGISGSACWNTLSSGGVPSMVRQGLSLFDHGFAPKLGGFARWSFQKESSSVKQLEGGVYYSAHRGEFAQNGVYLDTNEISRERFDEVNLPVAVLYKFALRGTWATIGAGIENRFIVDRFKYSKKFHPRQYIPFGVLTFRYNPSFFKLLDAVKIDLKTNLVRPRLPLVRNRMFTVGVGVSLRLFSV